MGICLVAQPSPESPEISKIKQYTSRIATAKELEISQMVYHQFAKKPAFTYPVIAGSDTIFYTWSTDFPCAALLYHAGNNLVKIKEFVNAGSCFAVNQYYLKDNKLVFVEAKEVLCEFLKQSPKITYTEKDYIFHGKYFFAGDSCIHAEERGESRYGFGRFPIPARKPAKPRTYFYNWQADRYARLFQNRVYN